MESTKTWATLTWKKRQLLLVVGLEESKPQNLVEHPTLGIATNLYTKEASVNHDQEAFFVIVNVAERQNDKESEDDICCSFENQNAFVEAKALGHFQSLSYTPGLLLTSTKAFNYEQNAN